MAQGNKTRGGEVAGILLPMGLVCLFAFCALALALLGGRAYKQIQTSVDEGFGTTVAAGYLRTKLSQFNHGGSISLRSEGDIQVLAIENNVEGSPYETRIYLHEGRLMENYQPASTPFDTLGGIQVAELRSCSFSLEDNGLFTARLVGPDGLEATTNFALAQGGGL